MGFEAQSKQHSNDSPSPTEFYDKPAGQLERALLSCTDTPSPKATGERPLYSSKPKAGDLMHMSLDRQPLWLPVGLTTNTHIEAALHAPGDPYVDTKPDQYGIQPATIHVNEQKDGTVTAYNVSTKERWQLTVTEDERGLEWKPLKTDNSKR